MSECVRGRRSEESRGGGRLKPSLSGALVSTSRCAAPAECDGSIESSIDDCHRVSPPCDRFEPELKLELELMLELC